MRKRVADAKQKKEINKLLSELFLNNTFILFQMLKYPSLNEQNF